MYNNNVYDHYLENEVLTADPLKLVTILYQGALEAVREARKCLRQGDIVGRSRRVSKATGILNELALGLDHGKGGDVSRSLAELYDYLNRRLNEANFRQIEEPLIEVEKLIETLLDAWQGLAAKPESLPAPSLSRTAPSDYRRLSLTA